MKKLFLCLFFVSGLSSYAQEQELRQVVSASPETAALTKFIDTPVNYNNGLPSVQIPFYTIQTRSGLSIPIYMSYHASGIKVNEHATQVGLGWKLSVGGMISSQTYGETDIFGARRYPRFTNDLSNSLARFGLITEIGDLYCASPEDLSISYDYALDVTGFGIQNGHPKLGDAQPDIFYYETPTGSGKFVYDSEFNAHPIPYAPVTITRHIGDPNRLLSVLDEQGNAFVYNNTSFYSTEPNRSLLSNTFIEQYKLSKVTTSLNETVNYTYSSENYMYLNPSQEIDYTKINNGATGCGDKAYYDSPVETHFINQRLDKIDFDSGRIEFYYSDDPAYAIENSTIRKDLPGTSALRRVVVYNDQNDIIKDFELIYSYFETSGGASTDPDKYRLKLDRVLQKGEQPYDFTYTGNGTIPHRLSDRQDYWGYYGGTGGLLPAVRFEDIELPGSNRSVNESLLKIGSLEKITYPTGGSTRFYFNETTYTHPQTDVQSVTNRTAIFNTIGTHTFSLPADDNNNRKIYFINECGDTTQGISEDYCSFRLLDQNGNAIIQNSTPGVYEFFTSQPAGTTFTFILEGNPLQTCNYGIYMEGESLQETLVDKKTQLPGLRLDRMVAESLTGTPITTTFDYRIPGSNRISKDVDIPLFHYLERTTTSTERNHEGPINDCRYLVRKGNPVFSTQSSYDHVTERIAGNGSVKYTFNPSRSGMNNTSVLRVSLENVESGKLLSKEVYSESQKILSKEEHSYETDYSTNQASSDYRPQHPAAVTLGFSFSNNGSWTENCLPSQSPGGSLKYLLDYDIYHINNGWVKNKQSTNTMYYYDDDDVLLGNTASTTNYFYDNSVHAQVTRTEVINSSGETLETKTYFADDVGSLTGLSSDERNAIERLRKNNLHQIGVPIQVESFIKEEGNTTKLSTQRTLFNDLGNGIVLPRIVQSAKGDDDLENRLEYIRYDSKGNILEAKKSNGSYVAYIWAYEQRYPVAKIDNATFSEVAIAMGLSTQSLISNGLTDFSKLDLLRGQLSNALVTTYTYAPLIGMTKTTDPSGYSMTYEYDTFNRLKRVRDANGNIISENTYNYKNQ